MLDLSFNDTIQIRKLNVYHNPDNPVRYIPWSFYEVVIFQSQFYVVFDLTIQVIYIEVIYSLSV